MGTYIDLDSYYRDSSSDPNPAKYTVHHTQTASWNRAPRQVMAHSSRPGSTVLEFTQSVQCKHVILPYLSISYVNSSGATVNTHTADLQRIYLDVHTSRYNDIHLMNIIGGRIPKARFSLLRESIQSDSGATPKWVKFICRMDQVMRFARNESLEIDIMQEDGYTIVITDGAQPERDKQTNILLEVKPYFRDADYQNHAVGLTQH